MERDMCCAKVQTMIIRELNTEMYPTADVTDRTDRDTTAAEKIKQTHPYAAHFIVPTFSYDIKIELKWGRRAGSGRMTMERRRLVSHLA